MGDSGLRQRSPTDRAFSVRQEDRREWAVGQARRIPANSGVNGSRQAEVFLGSRRRGIAEHRAAIPADHRRADAAGDVVVTGRDVGGERPERAERRFVTPLELLGHVFLGHVQRHVARAFVHHLHAFGPRALGEFAALKPVLES